MVLILSYVVNNPMIVARVILWWIAVTIDPNIYPLTMILRIVFVYEVFNVDVFKPKPVKSCKTSL